VPTSTANIRIVKMRVFIGDSSLFDGCY